MPRKYNQDWDKRQGKTCRVGPLVVNTITPICQQNGFIQARLVLEWDYIVMQFAQWCTPVKIKFPWPHRNNGCLLLRATSSMATEIVYYEPLILSKVNQYFGYQAVSSLKILQEPVFQKISPKKPAKKPLSEAAQSSLAAQVQSIEDDRLRAALLSLGMGISQEKASA
ncbi:MAG: hypothetical protein K0R76_296 [Alphaproteobacteria bacterium]|nr:hypothetical protein [Alphaproteobacteria bacterium]